MDFKVGFATLRRNDSSPPGGLLNLWCSRLCFSFVLLPAALWASTRLDATLPMDSPLGSLRPAVARAWLLDDAAPPPPAAWPLDRGHWLRLPATPRLAFHASQGEGERHALLRWHSTDLRLSVGPRAEAFAWRRQDGARVDEQGNGLDVEGRWGSHVAFWAHVRDMGLKSKGDLTQGDMQPASSTWLWHTVEQDGVLTHDEARTGLAWSHSVGKEGRVHLAMAREHLRWGSGLLRTAGIQGDRTPNWPMLLLSFEQGPLSYTQHLGQLFSGLWLDNRFPDEAGDRQRLLAREKWLVAHRLEWRAAWGSVAATEAVVLGDRRPDLGYVAPVGLIWSEQHALWDQDNSLFFLDARLRLPRALPGAWMLYGDLLLDDYSLSQVGEELEGQRVASLVGLSGCPLPTPDATHMRLGALTLPGISWWTVELGRQRPFVGGHFFAVNRFDHGDRSLALFDDPNTRAVEWEWRHESGLPRVKVSSLELRPLLELHLGGAHQVHGGNGDSLNVGGDRHLPHSESLPQAAPFLAGQREVQDRREWGLDLSLQVKWRQRTFGHLQLGYQDQRLRCRPDSLAQGWQAFSMAWRMPM